MTINNNNGATCMARPAASLPGGAGGCTPTCRVTQTFNGMSNRKVNPDSLRQVTRYINEYSQHIWDNELTGDKEFVRVKENNKLKKLEEQLKYDEARLKSLQEGTKEYFAQQRVIENDAYEAQKAKAKDNATELEAIEIAHKAVLKNIDQAELEAKRNLQLQIADLYAGFGRSLQQIAGKNKALAIAGLLVEQAAGVATIIINTQKAAAKAGYFTPLGIATLVAGAASVVAAVVATKKGIDQINQTQIPGGASAGGGTSMAQAMPTYTGGGAGSATIPQINASGGANPATQISETIQQSSSKPMRAYVVSGDVTTQQALDRRTNKGATFGLG